MLKRELKKIKKNLPKGGQVLIAKSLGISQQTVNFVLNGKRTDHHNIIDLAIEIAEKSIKEKEVRKQLIREKISSL